MRRLKVLFAASAFLIFSFSAFAAEATVTFVSGKVEVQRNGEWIALNKGDSVSQSETISTGFQSEAKIKLMDSVMYLGPVTRITLEELSVSGQQDNVNVYLKTGSARSQVRHVDNKRVNYQVHTAVAVASCRGTDWIIDDSNNVSCFDGIVEVTADAKAPDSASGKGGILVKANQKVVVSDTNSVSAPVNEIVDTVNNVTNAVSSASSRESVDSSDAAADSRVSSVNTEGENEASYLVVEVSF